jgi:uncharacterized protein (TIGR02145 family)
LHGIVQQFGREILGQARLIGLLADFKPDTERKYLTILRQAVNDGVGSKLLELEKNKNSGSMLQINVLKENLKNNHGFSNTADYVVDCFLFALGWIDKPPKEEQNLVQGNNLSILEQTVKMAFSDGKLTKEEAKSIFTLAQTLNISEDQATGLIDVKIKTHNLQPDKPIAKTLKNKKKIIISRNWITENLDIAKKELTTEKVTTNDLKPEKQVNKKSKRKSGIITSRDCLVKSGVKSENDKEAITIGRQVWMKRNLDVSHFRNSDTIPEAKTKEEWVKAGKQNKPAWCTYKNDPKKGKQYGKLYNWQAVNDPRGLAPQGWHVPEYFEWQHFFDFLAAQWFTNVLNNSTSVANAIKSCRQVNSPLGGACATNRHPRWNADDENYGFDAVGFSALPGGNRSINGNFSDIGFRGYWWSSKVHSSVSDMGRHIYFGSGIVICHSFESYGFSVRCIRD